MSKGVQVVNHPSGGLIFVSERNAARMIEQQKAKRWNGPRSIRLLDQYWHDLNDKMVGRLKRQQAHATAGYDGINRMLRLDEVANLPVAGVAKLFQFGKNTRGKSARLPTGKRNL